MSDTLPAPQRLRWRLAGELRRRLPDVRGRARLSKAVFGPRDASTVIRFGPDLVFDLDLRDLDQFSTWFLQFQAPALGPLLDRVLRAGDGFVDVGANIGIYTCWAARIVGPAGWVHAVEPVPATADVLERHVHANQVGDRVTVARAAAGERAGTMTLYQVPGASGWTSPYPRGEGSQAIAVPVGPVDAQIADRPPPRLVKIDVEGFEQQVLKGMSRLLRGEAPPVVAIEFSDRQLRAAGSSAAALLADVGDVGYQPWRITTRGLRRMSGATDRDMNVVLLHPRWHAHEARLLAATHFPRDWTT